MSPSDNDRWTRLLRRGDPEEVPGYGLSRRRATMALHLDTGVASVDAEDDFTRARRRYELDRLGGWLRREPGQTQLLRFDDVVSALGFRGEYYLGPRTIRLDTVVGTVEDTRGFDRRFQPASNRDRQRWERLDLAERHDAVIPP